MFSKLAVLSLFALALAKPHISGGHLPAAAKYPAGVSPHECPNFPFCDNVRLHNRAAAWQDPHNSWHSDSAWQHMPHWSGYDNSWNDHGHWKGAALGAAHGGDKYPAGVNPHTCPNYPFCDIHAGGSVAHASPLPGWTERQYPAGVSPHSCPNFPYCH